MSDTRYQCANPDCGHQGDVIRDHAIVDRHGDVWCDEGCYEDAADAAWIARRNGLGVQLGGRSM